MVSFIEKHATECPICLGDPDLQEEIEKITEMILPESKIPKAVRMQQEQDELDRRASENDDDDSTEESNDTDEDEDGDGDNDTFEND